MTDPAMMAKYADPGDCQIISPGQPTLETLATMEELFYAYKCAAKQKRHRPGVQRFELDLGYNLTKLRDELLSGAYKPRPCVQFEIFCRSGQKTRMISAPVFRDTVVQHLLYQAFYPIFDQGFIFDSYGCRRGKGTHRAADRVQEFMRGSPEDSYFLQLDVRRYYYSIDHAILRESLSRKMQDERLVDIFMSFADAESGVGLNVGCLVSQLFGMIYLDRLDHYIKRVLKVKRYVRYVDDMVLIGLSRTDAKEIKSEIERYLADELHLSLSKWKLLPLSRGINFAGIRTWRNKRLVRKRSLHTFSKSLKSKNLRSLESCLGHAMNTSSYSYFLDKLANALDVEDVRRLSPRVRSEIAKSIGILSAP